jgi:hypothetical protein
MVFLYTVMLKCTVNKILKKNFVAYFRCRNLLVRNPANWLTSTGNVGYGPHLSRLPSSCNSGIVQYWLCQFLLLYLIPYLQMHRLYSFEWESYNELWIRKEAGIFTLLENYQIFWNPHRSTFDLVICKHKTGPQAQSFLISITIWAIYLLQIFNYSLFCHSLKFNFYLFLCKT